MVFSNISYETVKYSFHFLWVYVVVLFPILYPSRIVICTICFRLVFFLEDTLLCLSLDPLSGPSNGVVAKPLYLLSIPGEYLALTGEKLNGAEMLSCGLATHFSPFTVLPTDHNFIYFGYVFAFSNIWCTFSFCNFIISVLLHDPCRNFLWLKNN